ncbi:hypothetical protein PG991_011638 [Apiospora marii]|uniref:Uncharacterized protein n=1 Tax=Apiospora marii TaxID=335849 RepID=A0ABR1REN5_9PEZI
MVDCTASGAEPRGMTIKISTRPIAGPFPVIQSDYIQPQEVHMKDCQVRLGGWVGDDEGSRCARAALATALRGLALQPVVLVVSTVYPIGDAVVIVGVGKMLVYPVIMSSKDPNGWLPANTEFRPVFGLPSLANERYLDDEACTALLHTHRYNCPPNFA